MLTIIFIILTTVSSLVGYLFIQEKQKENISSGFIKRLTNIGWLMFFLTLILGTLSIYLYLEDKNEKNVMQLGEIKLHQKDSINLENKIKILMLENSILKSKTDSALFELSGIKTSGSEIHELAKRIQSPLPSEVELSFDLCFKLESNNAKKFDSIIRNRNMVFDSSARGKGFEVNSDIMNEFINLNETCKRINVDFANDYKNGSLTRPLFSLTNEEDFIRHQTNFYKAQFSFSYFPFEKEFRYSFRDIKLQISRYGMTENYGIKSIIDLNNTTLFLSLHCLKNMEELKVRWFRISSKELKIMRYLMDSTDDKTLFATKINNL